MKGRRRGRDWRLGVVYIQKRGRHKCISCRRPFNKFEVRNGKKCCPHCKEPSKEV